MIDQAEKRDLTFTSTVASRHRDLTIHDPNNSINISTNNIVSITRTQLWLLAIAKVYCPQFLRIKSPTNFLSAPSEDESTIKVAPKKESKDKPNGTIKLKKPAPKHSKPGNWRDGSVIDGMFCTVIRGAHTDSGVDR